MVGSGISEEFQFNNGLRHEIVVVYIGKDIDQQERIYP